MKCEWETKVEQFVLTDNHDNMALRLEESIERVCQNGWELVSASFIDTTQMMKFVQYRFMCTFKRKKEYKGWQV